MYQAFSKYLTLSQNIYNFVFLMYLVLLITHFIQLIILISSLNLMGISTVVMVQSYMTSQTFMRMFLRRMHQKWKKLRKWTYPTSICPLTLLIQFVALFTLLKLKFLIHYICSFERSNVIQWRIRYTLAYLQETDS